MSTKQVFILYVIFLNFCAQMAIALDSKQSSVQEAFKLYNQHAYSQSATAFDHLLTSVTPTANLCYYAALANMQCHNTIRANQLFNYIVTNFPASPEAAYSRKVLSYQSSQKQGTQASQDNELPETLKNALTPEQKALLATPAGKAAIGRLMEEQAAHMIVIKNAENQGLLKGESLPQLDNNNFDKKQESVNEKPFSAADIARDGASGIDQTRFPNCWFEASMSALAELPRGQQILADTIRYGPNNTYVVRFRNDGTQYNVSESDIKNSGIHDRALWASIIECAEIQKFPGNVGAEGTYDDQSRLQTGLGCISGSKAEVLPLGNCEPQELSAFIGGAVKSRNPIVAATYGITHFVGMPLLVVPSHAYTIIDFDPSTNMVTLRNPHGAKSQLFGLKGDPQHLEFQQLGAGLFKMNISTMQKYFHSVARAFI